MHPIASVLNHGIPVCLCSDDPSAFGNLGLSFDFYQVLVSSEQTGLITLGEIALDSLKVRHPHPANLIHLKLTAAYLVFNARRGEKGTGDQFVEEAVDDVLGGDCKDRRKVMKGLEGGELIESHHGPDLLHYQSNSLRHVLNELWCCSPKWKQLSSVLRDQ